AIKRIALPDGSEITLNVGTSIRYNAAREVWLDEGEAFFDVTPDIENPFTVHLRNGLSVRVLGTSFTVQSYAELPFQQIDVLSGKVTVSAPDNETVELVSDQKATYRATKLSRQTTNAAQKAAWRTGTVVLVNASFAELRLRMRQLYGKNIVFEDVSQNISIHITLHRTAQPLEIADEIAALYGLSYRITPDKIVFQPQK
ncbi:FecR family protein, partial [Bacteroides heparinolyticus]